MEYGWLASSDYQQQKDGFFVDFNNQILFWPRKIGPGFIIDLETSYSCSKLLSRYNNIVTIYEIVFFCIFYAFTRYVSETVSSPFVLMVIGVVGLICLFLGGLSYAHRWKHKRLSEVLENSPRISGPRPRIHYLSLFDPTTYTAKIVWFFALLFIAALGAMGGYLLVAAPDLYGQVLGFFIFAYALYFAFKKFHMIRNTVSHKNIRYYKPTSQGREKYFPDHEANEVRLDTVSRSKNRLIKYTVVAIATLIIALVGGYLAYPKIDMTSGDLDVRFEKLAFSEAEGDKTITKWNKPILVRIGIDLQEKFRKNLEGQITAFSDVAGVPVSFVEKKTSPADVSLSFDGKSRSALVGKLKAKQGILSSIDIKFGKAILKNDGTVDQPRDLALLAAIYAFGMQGQYEFAGARYEHHIGEIVRIPLALVALYYDPRIVPGMSRDEGMPIARKVTKEIVSADSFAEWLRQRDAK